MRRTLVTFLTLFVLWVIVAQVNHALANTAVMHALGWCLTLGHNPFGAHICLFVGGLFVSYAALQLPPKHGLAAVLLAGLLCDAGAPVPFGLHTILFAAGYAVVFHVRDHVPREETVARVFVALLVNLGMFLLISFVLIGRGPAPGSVWPRLIFDLLCSQVFLALIAPWFFALQARALVLARVDRDSLI